MNPYVFFAYKYFYSKKRHDLLMFELILYFRSEIPCIDQTNEPLFYSLMLLKMKKLYIDRIPDSLKALS